MRKNVLPILLVFALVLMLVANSNYSATAINVGDSYKYDIIHRLENTFNNSEPYTFEISYQEQYNVTAYNTTSNIINFTYVQINPLFGPMISDNTLNLTEAYTYISWTLKDLDHDDYYDLFDISIETYSFVYPNMTKNIEMLNKTLNDLLGNNTLVKLVKKDFNTENNTFTIKLRLPVAPKYFIKKGFETFRGFAYVTLKLVFTSDNVVKLNSVVISSEELENPKHGTTKFVLTSIKVLHEEAPAGAGFDFGSLLAGQSMLVMGGVAVVALIVGVGIGKKL